MTNRLSGNRRYLALWFPHFSADRLRICQPRLVAKRPDAPTVLVEKVKGAMRLAAVNGEARTLGILPGLALADARARVPDLSVYDHDPSADQLWLERLADGCVRYTPMVALGPPDGLILDVTGCMHLFGGEEALASDLELRLVRLGMTLRHAVASTPDAARALARYPAVPGLDEAEAVKRLPVAALRLDGEKEVALNRAGLKTVGDVARRPMANIAARFGADAVTALRHLLGEAEGPITPRHVVPPLIVERRFAEPIARTEFALAVLAVLTQEAVEKLAARNQGGRRFESLFFRTDGLTRALAVETGQPTRDVNAVMRLFGERLESLSDEFDPGYGYDLVRLSVPIVEPLAAAQLLLEGGKVSETEIATLVDRLSTRLGRGRVQRFQPQDTHIPEQAQLALPAIDARPSGKWRTSNPGEPPMRPIHLFDPPQRIDVTAEVPDGPPRRFRWRGALYMVKHYEGPERIAAAWWQRKDGKGLTRDYYRIEDARGGRFWVFRHGLYGREKTDPGWYLHGLFA